VTQANLRLCNQSALFVAANFFACFISVGLLHVVEEVLLFTGLKPGESLILFEYTREVKTLCT